MTASHHPTPDPRRSPAERSAAVIDLASRRPSRAPAAAQPSTAWYHEAALREGEPARGGPARVAPPRLV